MDLDLSKLKKETSNNSERGAEPVGSIDALFSALVEGLDELVKVYRTLLEVVRREKDLLIASDLEELNENNNAKETLLSKTRQLENSRLKLARDLASALGTDVESPRLLEMAARMPRTEQGDRLRSLHAVLDLLLKRVAETNRQNEHLVQSALENISGAMDSLRSGLQEKPTYARQGALAPAIAEGGNLVRKQV